MLIWSSFILKPVERETAHGGELLQLRSSVQKVMKRTSAVLTDLRLCHLFFTEEALLNFQKLRMYEVSYVDETSILTLVQLEAKITDAVNNLAESVANLEQIHNYKNKNAEAPRHAKEYEYIVKDSKTKSNGGCVPQVSEEKLKALLPLASSQLFQRRHKRFVERYRKEQTSVTKELSLTVPETTNGRNNNTCSQKLSFFGTMEMDTFKFP